MNEAYNARLRTHREWKTAELRIMHIAVVLFTILTATLSLTLCACGVIIPIVTGRLGIALIRLSVGCSLGALTYDFNHLRQIVYTASMIFEEYTAHPQRISHAISQKWTAQIEQMKTQYKKLYIAGQLLEFVWPLTNPPPAE
jgi:hypothetical protein